MSIPFIKQFDDFAEAMANPNPDRPIQDAVASIGRAACDRISARPELFTPTILQSPLVAACTPYWESQGYDGPIEFVPFTGGQCPTLYRVRGDRYDLNTGALSQANQIFATNFQGPLTFEELPGSPPPGGCTTGTYSGGSRVLNAGGIAASLSSAGCSLHHPSVRNIRLERLDGLPDNCGDPDSITKPGPNPAPDPGPLPPDTGPQVNIRGGVVFVLPPTLEINPNLSVELPIGEINLGSGTGGGPAEEPLPGEELAGEGNGTGGGENDFGDPPDGERWVGCCIRITSAPVGAGVIPSSIPHDVYPIVVGNARLKFQGQSGPLTYDTPIQKRQETSCLWEPVRGMAPVGCFVNLLPGYSYTVRPYSVPLEQ